MKPEVLRAVEEVLDALLRGYDANVAEAGPFPPYRREVTLPAPYGPRLRVALEVHPSPPSEEYDPEGRMRYVDRRLETGDGYRSQMLYTGTTAQLRERLRAPGAAADVEQFLEWALEDYDEVIEAEQPLDVPLVAVDRDGALYAVLDPRQVSMERSPWGTPHTAKWRLLLRRGDGWLDAGVASTLTEEGRGYLRIRVERTVAAFEGLAFEEFGFRRWEGAAPEATEAAPGDEVDRTDPAAARLREICNVVVGGMPNVEEELRASSAFAEGGDHVLEVLDTFDNSYYYVPVPPGEDPEEVAAEVGSRSMQEVRRTIRRDQAVRPVDAAGRLRERLGGADAPASPPPESPARRPGLLARLVDGLGAPFRRR